MSKCRKVDAQILDYSITSLARVSMVGGATNPSILAVLALMTSSKIVACSVVKSCGRELFRIRSVSLAIWRKSIAGNLFSVDNATILMMVHVSDRAPRHHQSICSLLPYPVKGRIELLGYVDLHSKYCYPSSSCDVSVLLQDASRAQVTSSSREQRIR